nr:unnamed protein product [Callosobruchus analis]
MHCVCLGVMKKLLTSWVGGDLKVRLNSRKVILISDHLKNLKSYIPDEFNRKPRGLDELARWKATEFRLFLLYLGPVVLRDKIDRSVYEHFLLLHCAISILSSFKHISTIGCEFAKRLLHTFVGHCKKIYGLEYLIYNIHILSHLSDDVAAFGPLDSFSAFPFENFLGELKLYIKSPKNPLIQIYRRLMERKDTYYCEDDIKNKRTIEHCNGPLLQTAATYKQFKKLFIKNVQFSIASHSLPNSFSLLRGNKVAQIYNIVVSENEEIFVVVKCFVSFFLSGALFEYPFDSCHLQIKLVNNFSNLEMLHISDIITKCLLMPYKDDRFVSFPLLLLADTYNQKSMC